MSGGVDSAVAALILKRAGLNIEGAFMKNWINEDSIAGDCPWQQDLEDARRAAEILEIPFRVVNLMREYRQRVVEYLLAGYAASETPNPDVMCNREIKFGVFADIAKEEGFDYVATGHYCRRMDGATGPELWEGVDKSKDQSYFLALLSQSQLVNAVFPIGEIPKSDVRAMAAEAGLQVATKKDSQGICFVGQVKMRDFLQAYLPNAPGNVVNPEGKVVGRHQGIHLYTIGQRRGVGVASNQHGMAYVVIAKRPESNELVVALETETTPGLWGSSAVLTQLSWLADAPEADERLDVRVRYRAPRTKATWQNTPDAPSVIFDEPQRALAIGQICALHRGEQMIGGGVYQQIR